MSDENGDSAAEAGASASSVGGGGLGTGGDDLSDITDPALASRLEAIHQSMSTLGTRIDALVTATTSYRAALTDRLTAVEEAVGSVRASRSGGDARGGDDVASVLDEFKLTLQDLASGEVVGSLWEEFRHLRATVETLVDDSASTADPEAVEALRADVIGLTDSVRALLDAADVADDDPDASAGTAVAPPVVADGALDQLAADVAALRGELSEGLVVEASGDLMASVDQLRSDLAAVGDRFDGMTEVRETVAGLRDTVAELRDAAAAPSDDALAPAEVTVDTSELDAELQTMRRGIDDIIARLDEGLDLEIDASSLLPAAESGPQPSTEGLSELGDQVATLRDLLTTEFDAIRQQLGGAGFDSSASESVDLVALTARLDRLHDDIADQQSLAEEIAAARDTTGAAEPGAATIDLTPVTEALAELQEAMAFLLDRSSTAADQAQVPGAGASASSEFAALDPDTIDLLREEIRASAMPAAELIDTLNTELKALRRRIKLRAEGEIFSDDQLELIADAVAKRLER